AVSNEATATPSKQCPVSHCSTCLNFASTVASAPSWSQYWRHATLGSVSDAAPEKVGIDSHAGAHCIFVSGVNCARCPGTCGARPNEAISTSFKQCPASQSSVCLNFASIVASSPSWSQFWRQATLGSVSDADPDMVGVGWQAGAALDVAAAAGGLLPP